MFEQFIGEWRAWWDTVTPGFAFLLALRFVVGALGSWVTPCGAAADDPARNQRHQLAGIGPSSSHGPPWV